MSHQITPFGPTSRASEFRRPHNLGVLIDTNPHVLAVTSDDRPFRIRGEINRRQKPRNTECSGRCRDTPSANQALTIGVKPPTVTGQCILIIRPHRFCKRADKNESIDRRVSSRTACDVSGVEVVAKVAINDADATRTKGHVGEGFFFSKQTISSSAVHTPLRTVKIRGIEPTRGRFNNDTKNYGIPLLLSGAKLGQPNIRGGRRRGSDIISTNDIRRVEVGWNRRVSNCPLRETGLHVSHELAAPEIIVRTIRQNREPGVSSDTDSRVSKRRCKHQLANRHCTRFLDTCRKRQDCQDRSEKSDELRRDRACCFFHNFVFCLTEFTAFFLVFAFFCLGCDNPFS